MVSEKSMPDSSQKCTMKGQWKGQWTQVAAKEIFFLSIKEKKSIWSDSRRTCKTLA